MKISSDFRYTLYLPPSAACKTGVELGGGTQRAGLWQRTNWITQNMRGRQKLCIQINNRFRPWLKEELHSWKLRDVKSSMHPCKMPPGGDETPQFGAIHPSIQLSILSHFLVESASSVWAFSDWGLSGYFLINCLFFFSFRVKMSEIFPHSCTSCSLECVTDVN